MLAGVRTAISIRAIVVVANTARGGAVALQRSFAIGTGTTIATAVEHNTLASGADGTLASAWSQAPTGYTSAIRRAILQDATGAGFDLWWEHDGPLTIEPNKSLLLVNHGSGIDAGGLQVSFTWEEAPR
jgi:hypothetical protein